MLYGTMTEFCTPEECPIMSAGPKLAENERAVALNKICADTSTTGQTGTR